MFIAANHKSTKFSWEVVSNRWIIKLDPHMHMWSLSSIEYLDIVNIFIGNTFIDNNAYQELEVITESIYNSWLIIGLWHDLPYYIPLGFCEKVRKNYIRLA